LSSATRIFEQLRLVSRAAGCKPQRVPRPALFAHAQAAEAFSSIVLGRALQANGMASFKERLKPDEVQSVRAYLIERANQAKAAPK
jgi:hypothetical protein